MPMCKRKCLTPSIGWTVYKKRRMAALEWAIPLLARAVLPPSCREDPATSPGNDACMSQKKILVVDDDRIIVRLTANVLTTAGYEVITAEDGGAAVAKARTVHPHLIVLDMMFPPDVAHGGGVPWDGF